MQHLDVAASLLRRVWTLRQFAMLEGAELDELATLAQNVIETELEPGTIIATAGERVADVHFVLEGELGTHDGSWRWTHQELCGAAYVIADLPAPQTVVALARSRTLRLQADDLDDILQDNFGVLIAALRSLARQLLARDRRLAVLSLPATQPGGLVERLLALRRQAPFAQAHPRPLVTLAHAAREVSWPANTTIVTPAGPVEETYIILAGELRAGDVAVTAGGSIGLLELLGERPHSHAFETRTATRAIAITGPALLDVLEDHSDLGLDMLRAMSRSLVAGAERRS
jgi:CRP-like cAMP-binding protein